MNLGAFSISLAVKDLAASKEFYSKLGFEVIDGDESQNWLMLQNANSKIGLFQGMFPQNTLTFHPEDVRQIQKQLKSQGVNLTLEADETQHGSAYITLLDPDGNPILLDQH